MFGCFLSQTALEWTAVPLLHSDLEDFMSRESSELRERMARLSDDELLRIVTVDAEQYRPEALDFAKAEFKTRDIDFADPQVVPSPEQNSDDSEESAPLTVGKHRLTCLACGGQMRSGVLVAEKELSIIFTDNKEERFVRVDACRQCGQIALTVDYETSVE